MVLFQSCPGIKLLFLEHRHSQLAIRFRQSNSCSSEQNWDTKVNIKNNLSYVNSFGEYRCNNRVVYTQHFIESRNNVNKSCYVLND